MRMSRARALFFLTFLGVVGDADFQKISSPPFPEGSPEVEKHFQTVMRLCLFLWIVDAWLFLSFFFSLKY